MKYLFPILICFSITVLFLGCDPDDPIIIDPVEYKYYPTGVGVIGTKGGEVYIADSTSPIFDAVCSIRENTLSGPVTVRLAQAPETITVPGHPDAKVIYVTPDTLALLQNAIVGMSYRHFDVDSDWLQIYRFVPTTGQLIPLSYPNPDPVRKIIYGQTDKLGYFTILQSNVPVVTTGQFIDTRDNEAYRWVKINSQVWMAENVRYIVPEGSYCYNNNPVNCQTYGRLYEMPAAITACPPGWHLPTHEEWHTLEKSLGLSTTDYTPDQFKTEGSVGYKLKSLTGWAGNGNGSDAVQFAILPGGFRDGDGSYSLLTESGRFWTSTLSQTDYWARYFFADHDGVYWGLRGPGRAFSVRCIQGEDETLPTVSTDPIGSITGFSALSGGDVTSQGGSPVIERGVCWNTSGNPDKDDSRSSDGSGTGQFTSQLTGLSPNTTYFVRAYATNSIGTGYGEQREFSTESVVVETGSITDTRDSKTYQTVKVGEIWWLAENLNYQTNEGSYCYNNQNANCSSYGRLYDWETAISACPPGWYLPSDEEWKEMEMILGMSQEDANDENWRHDGSIAIRMKSVSGWFSNGNGTNESKLNVMPAGFRDGDGTYSYLGQEARFWTGTVEADGDPWCRYLEYNDDGVYRSKRGKTRGMSVRCIQGSQSYLPTVTTNSVSSITDQSATSGGQITDEGDASVTARGVCWNTTGYPITNENYTVDGAGAGAFTSQLSDLLPNTTYYVRAYATNSYGTAYGNQRTFATDDTPEIEESTFLDFRDGQTYKIIKLNDTWWMAENLNYSSQDSWCYNESNTQCNSYGRLYTYDAAKMACPIGYHLATDEEWKQLEILMGMSRTEADQDKWRVEGDVGLKMKSRDDWFNTGEGTDAYKFNALPGGFRDVDGTYSLLGYAGRFWTATMGPGDDPWVRYLKNDEDGIYRDVRGPDRAFSIRCVKN